MIQFHQEQREILWVQVRCLQIGEKQRNRPCPRDYPTRWGSLRVHVLLFPFLIYWLVYLHGLQLGLKIEKFKKLYYRYWDFQILNILTLKHLSSYWLSSLLVSKVKIKKNISLILINQSGRMKYNILKRLVIFLFNKLTVFL